MTNPAGHYVTDRARRQMDRHNEGPTMTTHDNLSRYEPPPAVLQPALKVYGHVTRRDVASKLAASLRIETRATTNYEAATLELLLTLIRPLADAMANHETPNDRLAGSIIRVATAHTDLTSLANALLGLGWADAELMSTRVADLHNALVDVLTRQLGPYLTRMMRRWQEAGWFDLPSSEDMP
jgi:hypothetical protein